MAQNLSRFLSLNILLGLCGLAATQRIYIEYLLTGCLVLGGGCRGAQIVGGSAVGSCWRHPSPGTTSKLLRPVCTAFFSQREQALE